jgi:hypothetical protein
MATRDAVTETNLGKTLKHLSAGKGNATCTQKKFV